MPSDTPRNAGRHNGDQSPSSRQRPVPTFGVRAGLHKGMQELNKAFEEVRLQRYPHGPHHLPPKMYERVYATMRKLQREFGLPHILSENVNTRVGVYTGPAELLASPAAVEARSVAQILGQQVRGEAEEREYRGALSALASAGIFFGTLLSDRERATVYFSSDPDNLMIHNDLRKELIQRGEYGEGLPATSGMLVRRPDGGWTFLTDESGMIWPERVRPTHIGIVPGVTAGLADLAQPEAGSETALLGTMEGHILYAQDVRSLTRQQTRDYNQWVARSFPE